MLIQRVETLKAYVGELIDQYKEGVIGSPAELKARIAVLFDTTFESTRKYSVIEIARRWWQGTPMTLRISRVDTGSEFVDLLTFFSKTKVTLESLRWLGKRVDGGEIVFYVTLRIPRKIDGIVIVELLRDIHFTVRDGNIGLML